MQFHVLAAPTVVPLNANASVTSNQQVGGIWQEQDAAGVLAWGK